MSDERLERVARAICQDRSDFDSRDPKKCPNTGLACEARGMSCRAFAATAVAALDGVNDE